MEKEIKMDKSKAIEEFKNEVENCSACSLRQGCNRVVFGEGNPEAGLMVIGEGPGEEEDKQGRPFVGKAGQLLDKILLAGGFQRFTHVYIANIVKCRPPQNRIPIPEEKEACLPHLYKQIEMIKPKIIILLGATALQGLIDSQARITKARGVWQFWRGIWVMPTYHPAALLRNPQLKQPVWEDMKTVVVKYRELVDEKHTTPYC